MSPATAPPEMSEYHEAHNLRLDQRFVEVFNSIEKHLRATVTLPPKITDTFGHRVTEMCKQAPWTPHQETLMAFASLRNAVVHSMIDADHPFFLPSAEAVRQIEELHDAFLSPPRVLPRLEREVMCFDAASPMMAVFAAINENDFSQFPIFQGNDFSGLLTENGITRCVSKRVYDQDSLLGLLPAAAGDVLKWETIKDNVRFVSRDFTLEHLVYCFAGDPVLEAALITDDGEPSRHLLGIATRSDIMEISRFHGPRATIQNVAQETST